MLTILACAPFCNSIVNNLGGDFLSTEVISVLVGAISSLQIRVLYYNKRFLHCSIYPHSHPELDLDLSFDRESRIADCASHWASTCPGHTGIILGLGGLRMPMPQNCPIILASTCLTYRCRPSSWHQPAFRVLVSRKTE